MLHRRFCDVNRAVARAHGKDFHLLFLAVDLQLFNRCRTVNVTGYKQWLFAFNLNLPASFAVVVVLPGHPADRTS